MHAAAFIALLAVLAAPAFAQGYPHFSTDADTLELVRHGPDLAVLTYPIGA